MQNQDIIVKQTELPLIKRMKKSSVKPIGKTLKSFRSLGFLSTTVHEKAK